MTREGPLLERLTRRLAECPPDFLAEPRRPRGREDEIEGDVVVGAVVSDLLLQLGGFPISLETAERVFGYAAGFSPEQRNRLGLVLILCWLLHDEWFRSNGPFADAALALIAQEAAPLTDIESFEKFVTDPERREELARLTLAKLGLRPAGETEEQAEDRLTTISTVERERVIREARAAEARVAQIREAMARKAAEEAAASYGRE